MNIKFEFEPIENVLSEIQTIEHPEITEESSTQLDCEPLKEMFRKIKRSIKKNEAKLERIAIEIEERMDVIDTNNQLIRHAHLEIERLRKILRGYIDRANEYCWQIPEPPNCHEFLEDEINATTRKINSIQNRVKTFEEAIKALSQEIEELRKEDDKVDSAIDKLNGQRVLLRRIIRENCEPPFPWQ